MAEHSATLNTISSQLALQTSQGQLQAAIEQLEEQIVDSGKGQVNGVEGPGMGNVQESPAMASTFAIVDSELVPYPLVWGLKPGGRAASKELRA